MDMSAHVALNLACSSLSITMRAAIGKSHACLAAQMGVKEMDLEILHSDAMVGGLGHRFFVNKK